MRGVQRNGNSGKYIVAFSRSLLNHKFGHFTLLQRKQKRYVPKCKTNAWSHCFCSLNLLFVELVLFHVPKWIKISLLVYTTGVILAIYATRAEWHLASRVARDPAESWMAFIFNHSEQRQSICLSVNLVILRSTGGLRVILCRANQALKLKKKRGQMSLQIHLVMVKLQVFSDNHENSVSHLLTVTKPGGRLRTNRSLVKDSNWSKFAILLKRLLCGQSYFECHLIFSV